ncbi:acyl-CoA dehydrogenase family protein [Nonomuraea insulae]|uniref:Acyl-CoA dehydrogenase family protein n=1 Tax=Nonomuraea insulae TaxID=1616787 RepID=A0ABW1CMX4_9ACTN
MVTTTEVPAREEFVRRVSALAPVLKANAPWAEQNRRLHEESIEALADAGVFKMRVPERFGGYECNTRTLVEVGAELAQADGSTAWTASVYWIPTWMVCLFPDDVQAEVFSTPDVRVCGTLSPTAMAAPVDGGVVVNGKWGFVSGALHSHWQEIVAIQIGPGQEPMPIMALVPTSELQIIDDWHTTGLQGTGSVSTVAQDVFIPAERVLPLPAILQEQYASRLNAGIPIYRAPLLPVASASSVGTVLGLAKAAKAAFLERLPGRKITYTGYEQQNEAPLTHLQVSAAVLKIDQAQFHAERLADTVDGKSERGEQWSLEERARVRADMGAVCSLAKEAVDILATASGGSSIYSDVPIQRILRDVQSANLHALMHPNTNSELYGRVLCGLPPNTLYI